jgi:hypothetical protein
MRPLLPNCKLAGVREPVDQSAWGGVAQQDHFFRVDTFGLPKAVHVEDVMTRFGVSSDVKREPKLECACLCSEWLLVFLKVSSLRELARFAKAKIEAMQAATPFKLPHVRNH